MTMQEGKKIQLPSNQWLEPVEMEVGPLAWGSWPETFIFLAVSGRGGSGRLAGGCVESGASKVWPGFLQEERGRCC